MLKYINKTWFFAFMGYDLNTLHLITDYTIPFDENNKDDLRTNIIKMFSSIFNGLLTNY